PTQIGTWPDFFFPFDAFPWFTALRGPPVTHRRRRTPGPSARVVVVAHRRPGRSFLNPHPPSFLLVRLAAQKRTEGNPKSRYRSSSGGRKKERKIPLPSRSVPFRSALVKPRPRGEEAWERRPSCRPCRSRPTTTTTFTPTPR
uniref:Uncharacterized protein n=1 Tax=Aegilops tauschii subsp. strangulata TaxID=200361 RepID=A0A452YGU9_AEGTS